MPQMKPMNWSLLMIFNILIMFTFISNLHSLYLINKTNNINNFKKKNNKYTIKW